MEILNKIIDYIGPSNLLTISVFLIGLFIAFYFYYRTFFRLVYSTNRICESCKNIKDWQNEQTKFVSRILIYNNGRKTLTSNEIEQLEVAISNGKFNNIQVLEGKDNLKITVSNDKLKIDFDHMDSRKAYVIQFEHQGVFTVNGRVSETGKILATEPIGWLWLNLIFTVFSMILIFYKMYFFTKTENPDIISIAINLVFLLGIYTLIRFIHGLLFIPDRLASKYLDSFDKWNRAFKRNF